MKHVCKRVCFSSANVGVAFSLSLETRRKSLLVPCSVYSWIIHLHAMLEEEEIFVSKKTGPVPLTEEVLYNLRAPYL